MPILPINTDRVQDLDELRHPSIAGFKAHIEPSSCVIGVACNEALAVHQPYNEGQLRLTGPVEDIRRDDTAADIGHVQLTGEAMIQLAHKIVAERDGRAKALGVPRGIEIPRKLIPGTVKEIMAELGIV